MHADWQVLQSNEDELFWAYPHSTESAVISNVVDVLITHGIVSEPVTDSERDAILNRVDTTPEATAMFAPEHGLLVHPLQLDRRIFTITQEFDLSQPLTVDDYAALAKLKFEYEAHRGYQFLKENEKRRIAGKELPKFLFDIFSIRGTQMLDMGGNATGFLIQLRIRETSSASAASLSGGYITDFTSAVEAIRRVLPSLGALRARRAETKPAAIP
jgi:hypothetical protein